MSQAENNLARQLAIVHSLPEFTREYRFAAEHVGPGKGLRERLKAAGLRDWRFDFAAPDLMLAVEVEGGGWSGGRHTRGAGFAGDLDKYDAAMRLGWTVYRCDPRMVKNGQALETVRILVDRLKNPPNTAPEAAWCRK